MRYATQPVKAPPTTRTVLIDASHVGHWILRSRPGASGTLVRMTYMKAPKVQTPPGLVQLMDGGRQVICFDLFATLLAPFPGNNLPNSHSLFMDAHIPFRELKLAAMPPGAVFELEFR
jgi:hypothetical protein